MRTRRPTVVSSRGIGFVDDISVRWERLESFPGSLLLIPEGLVREPHPLELVIRGLEIERALAEGRRP